VTAVPSALFAGLCVVDLVHRVTRRPGPDEKVTALSQELAAGGPATNAAATFAALGGSARLLTALGARPVGTVARSDLDRSGVKVVDLAAGDADVEPSVSAVVVVEGTGERSVVSRDAAPIDERSAVAVTRTALSEATPEVVLLDGHYPAVAMEVASWARTRRIPVILDAGRWKPHLAPLLALVDEVVCSGDLTVPTGSGFTAVAAYAHGLGARVVAQTHGPSPIEVSVEGRRSRVPVPSVVAVDTTGAGDVLHGAYAYHRAQGVAAERALRLAAEVASFRCAFAGARTWTAAWPDT
jgi:sugar/nucleoside kinase (ribokinase family)